MEKKIDSLIADLTCDDVIKCQNARRDLVAMESRAVEPLVKQLSNKKHWVRWESAKALGQIGDSAATGALVAALEDKEFDVRWLAAEALIDIGRDSLEPLLTALVDRGDKSVFLRQGAHHILHDMQRGNLDGILQPVMKALEDVTIYHEVLPVAKEALDTLKAQ